MDTSSSKYCKSTSCIKKVSVVMKNKKEPALELLTIEPDKKNYNKREWIPWMAVSP